MTKFIRGLFLAALLAVSCGPSHLPSIDLPSTNNRYGYRVDPCLNRDRCVINLVTPWCGACHQSLPFVQALRKRIKTGSDINFVIIVASDSQDRLDAMAEEIGGTVYFDTDYSFGRSAGCSGVPHWWVIDRNRKVLANFAGSPGSGDTDTLTWFAGSQLQIASYLR